MELKKNVFTQHIFFHLAIFPLLQIAEETIEEEDEEALEAERRAAAELEIVFERRESVKPILKQAVSEGGNQVSFNCC